jgi:hypothetical protein
MERAVSGNCGDWPRSLRLDAQALGREIIQFGGVHPNLSAKELEEYYFYDKSRLEAAPEWWRPTPRDVGDWEHAILKKWGSGLSKERWRILRARAANPPWGFPEIDNRESKYRGWSWRNYRWAIDQVWEMARG